MTNAIMSGAAVPINPYGVRGLTLRPDGRWVLRTRSASGDTMKTLGFAPEMDAAGAKAAAEALRAPQLTVAAAVSAAVAPAAVAPAPGLGCTFGAVAAAWSAFQTGRNGKPCRARTLTSHARHIRYLAALCDVPFGQLTVNQCHGVIQGVWKANGLHSAHRVLFTLASICAFAQTPPFNATTNPCAVIAQWLPKKPAHVPRTRTLDPQQFGVVCECIQMWHGDDAPGAAVAALQFVLYTAARVGEVQSATWGQFKDLDRPELARWEIPAANSKMDVAHTVPLSRQALAVIMARGPANQRADNFVFPAAANKTARSKGFVHASALTKILDNKLGKGVQSTHGLRSAFSTFMREAGHDDLLIEMSLGHKDKNAVRATYNAAQKLEPRRVLMQAWGDLADKMRDG